VVRRLRSVFLAPLLGLALIAAGCGGDGAAVQEVPGPPVTLTVPHQKGAADVSASATPTPSATPTATATPAAGSTGSTGTTGATGTNTGAAATPTPAANSPAAKQAPAADGSPPEQFEQFCEENAGAC
jgi:hypothetical protein